MAKMDIEASLKLSFLGGLISVSGSAGFLRDSTESSEEIDFIFSYESSTHSLTIPSITPKDNTELCTNKDFTHVVSTVTYGMGANFKLTRRFKRDESKQEISGNLHVLVKSIPQFSIEGSAKINISGTLLEESKKVDVTLYGDFVLERQPTSYAEAVEVYATIPKKLGTKEDNYSGAAPMKMILTPRSLYCSDSDVLLVGISKKLLDQVSRKLDAMERTKMDINGLMESLPAIKFPTIRKNLMKIETALEDYNNKFQEQLQNILPKIKGAGSSETLLIDLLNDYNNSPFKEGLISVFLSHRRREINIITDIMEKFQQAKFENLKIVDYEEANDIQKIINIEKGVIFNLNVIQPPNVTDSYLATSTINEEKMWFNNRDIVLDLGNQLKAFQPFALSNNKVEEEMTYLVQINLVKKTPYEIVAWNARDSFPFITPRKPEKPEVLEDLVNHNQVTLRISKPNNKFIENVQVLPWMFLEKPKVPQIFKFNDASSTDVVLKNLRPATVYSFSARYETDFGVSPDSENSHVIVTKPCSPPLNHRVIRRTSKHLEIGWDVPTKIGQGMNVSTYSVKAEFGSSKLTRQVTQPSVSFENLPMAETIKFTVKAQAPNTKRNVSDVLFDVDNESQPSFFTTNTLPTTMSPPRVLNKGLNNVTVAWTRVSKLPPGSSVDYYVITVTQYTTNGSAVHGSSTHRQADASSVVVHISGLAMGTPYGVQVKVSTTKGDSEPSPVTIFKTDYEKTKLDILKESILQQVRSEFNTADETLRKEQTNGDIFNRNFCTAKTTEIWSTVHNSGRYGKIEFRGTNAKTHLGSGRNFGGLLYLDGKPVCHNGFKGVNMKKNVDVVCRMAGWPNGWNSKIDQTTGTLDYGITNLECKGTENSLYLCKHEQGPVGTCGSNEGVYVECLF